MDPRKFDLFPMDSRGSIRVPATPPVLPLPREFVWNPRSAEVSLLELRAKWDLGAGLSLIGGAEAQLAGDSVARKDWLASLGLRYDF
ncbi:MAG: hypothetical protein ACO3RV_01860 [Luteolibacter sp.]